jgi:hypothetical protein
MQHTIYLPNDDARAEVQRTTAETLRIADWATPYLRRLQITLTVWRVRASDLSNPRVVAAFKARGVESLPALVAGPSAMVGCAAIEGYYKGVIASPGADIGAPPPHSGIAARNRGRPHMGHKQPGAADTAPTGIDNSPTGGDAGGEDVTGDDILAEFYGNEANDFKGGGAARDYEFGTAFS